MQFFFTRFRIHWYELKNVYSQKVHYNILHYKCIWKCFQTNNDGAHCTGNVKKALCNKAGGKKNNSETLNIKMRSAERASNTLKNIHLFPHKKKQQNLLQSQTFRYHILVKRIFVWKLIWCLTRLYIKQHSSTCPSSSVCNLSIHKQTKYYTKTSNDFDR